MKRPIGRYGARKIVEFIKETAPEIALRTTFIVGFPGETERDIQDLEDLVSNGNFSNLGVFTYSSEKGTPAAEMDGQVSEQEKEDRRARIMAAQQEVVQKRNESMLGSTQRVLVDGPHEDTDLLLSGRLEQQAPEVDGVVIINDIEDSARVIQAGDFVDVEIREVAGYDLVGCAV
jgi:ribosomal protein S12 methylthiotransferase